MLPSSVVVSNQATDTASAAAAAAQGLTLVQLAAQLKRFL